MLCSCVQTCVRAHSRACVCVFVCLFVCLFVAQIYTAANDTNSTPAAAEIVASPVPTSLRVPVWPSADIARLAVPVSLGSFAVSKVVAAVVLDGAERCLIKNQTLDIDYWRFLSN